MLCPPKLMSCRTRFWCFLHSDSNDIVHGNKHCRVGSGRIVHSPMIVMMIVMLVLIVIDDVEISWSNTPRKATAMQET